MEIILATNNKSKIEEFRELIQVPNVTLISMEEAGVDGSWIKETGRSYAENAMIKAREVAKATGKFAIGDDSGMEIDALNGFPGLYSARLNGHDSTSDVRNDIILRTMSDVPPARRSAKYVCELAIYDPNDLRAFRVTFPGEVHGTIGLMPVGSHGFSYDPIFVIEGDLTMAELQLFEKNRISHRAKAAKDLCSYIYTHYELMNMTDEEYLNSYEKWMANHPNVHDPKKHYASNGCEAAAMEN